MLGFSKSSKPRSSAALFSPISNEVANSFADIPKILNDIVNTTIVKDLKAVRESVAREYPELANSVNLVTQNGRLAYVMSGTGAADVEYGNEKTAPRAFLRKAAEKTSQNIQSAIQKVTYL